MSTVMPALENVSLRDKMSQCRRALLEAINVEDVVAISRKLIERAVEGFFPAAKLYLAYLFGPPGRRSLVDDLDEPAATVTQRAETDSAAVTQRAETVAAAVTKPMQTASLVTPEQERLFHESLLADPLDTASVLSIASPKRKRGLQ